VTLGRITKMKLGKYVGLSQFKWDLKKKSAYKKVLNVKINNSRLDFQKSSH
jgi:hypothetical protein